MKYLVVLFLLFSSTVRGQFIKDSHLWIEGRTGFLFLDNLGPQKTDDLFHGYGIFSSVNIIGKKKLWKGNLEIGLGYSSFYYNSVDLFSPIDFYPNYLNIHVGYELYLSKRFYVLTRLSSHIFLEKIEFRELIRRYYQNIELGLGFDIGRRFSFKVTTPITLLPMFHGHLALGLHIPATFYSPWVVQKGGIISLSYRIK